MAHTPSSSPKPGKVRELIPNKTWLLAVGAVAILAILLYPSIASDLKATPGAATEVWALSKPVPVEKTVTKVVKVQLDPVKWSEWISIAELKPPEVPDNARFQYQVNTPDWHEYRFQNGKTVLVPDKSWDEEESKKWLGTIPGSTFKLRGEEGEAIIRIDYIFSH